MSDEKPHSREWCFSLMIWTELTVLLFFSLLLPIYFLHLCSNQTVVSLWMWRGKIKSRPNSVVTSDSRPRKQNLLLNLTFTLASHTSCTSCSVLVVVDSSYKKHNIFIFKIVLINNTSMTAGLDRWGVLREEQEKEKRKTGTFWHCSSTFSLFTLWPSFSYSKLTAKKDDM